MTKLPRRSASTYERRCSRPPTRLSNWTSIAAVHEFVHSPERRPRRRNIMSEIGDERRGSYSSASESRLGRMLRPSAFAVVRLMTRSNLVGCSTGRAAHIVD